MRQPSAGCTPSARTHPPIPSRPIRRVAGRRESWRGWPVQPSRDCSSDRTRSRQATKLAGAITFRLVPPRLVSQIATIRSGRHAGRLQHDGPHHTEDRRRRSDAERQRSQCCHREAGSRARHPQPVTDVADGIFDNRGANLVARALLGPLHAANLTIAWRRAWSGSCLLDGSSRSADRCGNGSLHRDRSRTRHAGRASAGVSTTLSSTP